MRILDLIRSLDPAHGGTVEGLRQSVQATAALGHREEVLTLDAPDAPWLAGFPAPTHALGPVAGNYGYSAALLPWLRAHAADYDAVVVHGLWQYPGLAAWRALRHSPVPYFVFCHGMLDPWFRRRYPLKHLKKWLYWPWAEYRVLRDARAVLFTADEEARLAPQSFWLYRARPVVVGHGIAVDAHRAHGDAEAFLRAFPATRGKRCVLFMGRLHPKKGADLLIEAFARVCEDAPELHLVMAGPDSGGLRAALEARAVALGISHRITWTGMLQGALKWGALRAAAVFALPSHQENFGVAVAEALALDLPVLVSRRVNTWREIVRAGAGLSDEDSVEGTIALLRRWLALSPSQVSAMAHCAESCFRRHFQAAAAAQRLVAALSMPPANVAGSMPRRGVTE